MKIQYASKNKKHIASLVVFYIVLVVLFCASVFGVWAYFTARSQRDSTLTFANLNINLLQGNAQVSGSGLIINKTLLPGDEIDLTNIKVQNTEATDVYVLLKVEIIITPSESGAETKTVQHWCNLAGQQVDEQHVAVAATLIKASSSPALAFSEQIDGSLGNEYKHSSVNISITAYGIQTLLEKNSEYTTDAVYASYLIINQVAKG